jgi:hypothetical protein
LHDALESREKLLARRGIGESRARGRPPWPDNRARKKSSSREFFSGEADANRKSADRAAKKSGACARYWQRK